ncbi:hypothetical protein [Chenggangzhangella methanolivorans]|nr:hypothetical protein [Chenggangzhangella methanolivorans]
MGAGQVVSRNLGLIDILEISASKLKPDTPYALFVEGTDEPLVAFKTNEKGAAMASAVGPVRAVGKAAAGEAKSVKFRVVEGEKAKADGVPALSGG